MGKPTPKELVAATGISPSYASMILSEKPEQVRTPPRSLAIYILRKTGWRHETLDGLSEAQLSVLEEVDPWSPPAAQDVAA